MTDGFVEDIQKLEPGGWIELVTFDGTEIGAGILRFHGYPYSGSIFWQVEEFARWPMKMEGFAVTADQPPTPKITVANVDGAITALCLYFQDMVGAKIIRHRTLAKYLDAINFPGGVNPDADPDEHAPDDVWYVERKLMEDNEAVTFELSSGMDFLSLQLPSRQIVSNHCPWQYRSAECSYTGPPVAKADDTPTSDPALDRCGKRVISCKLRFGEFNELPTGAFPAAGLMRS
jgi:lambda family phage minor tail protein L